MDTANAWVLLRKRRRASPNRAIQNAPLPFENGPTRVRYVNQVGLNASDDISSACDRIQRITGGKRWIKWSSIY